MGSDIIRNIKIGESGYTDIYLKNADNFNSMLSFYKNNEYLVVDFIWLEKRVVRAFGRNECFDLIYTY